MIQRKGNIWDFYQRAQWIVVPTNGTVKKNGEAVMGRGIAFQSARRFPHLPKALGRKLESKGNEVYVFHVINVITFPTKNNWYEQASLPLIKKSAKQLVAVVDKMKLKRVFLPRVGCGNGKLNWSDVEPILLEILDDRFTIVENE